MLAPQYLVQRRGDAEDYSCDPSNVHVGLGQVSPQRPVSQAVKRGGLHSGWRTEGGTASIHEEHFGNNYANKVILARKAGRTRMDDVPSRNTIMEARLSSSAEGEQ